MCPSNAITPMRTPRNLIITAGLLLSLPSMARDWNSAHGHSPVQLPSAPAGASLRAAQCSPATVVTELDYNNVRAILTNGGMLWYNKAQSQPGYEVPKTPDRSGAKAIFAGGLWMGGLSPDNQLKLAAVRYRDGNDFWPGPLTTDGSANVTSAVCVRYDVMYPNLRQDAERHEAYYRCLADPSCDPDQEFPDGYVIPASYFDWPAINTDPGYDTYLAPFTDFNGDGDYVPSDGDYPGFDLSRTVECRKFREQLPSLYGDKNIWWVFNDKGNTHTETGGQPIGMEVRAQAFAFSTNDEVNNMTFYNYVLINRGTQTLTKTYFGQYADPDLGCADDDFTGCDVRRGLGYVYNWDDDDQSCNGNPGYGTQPPAIGIDFFEGPFQDYDNMDNPGPLDEQPFPDCNFAVENRGIGYKGIGIGYGDGVVDNERFGMRAFIYFNRDGPVSQNDPTLAVHYYNYLRSIWKDGTPQTYGGTGYQPNNPAAVPAYYMFPGDSDPIGWGTGCAPQQAWQETAQANPDRRFVESAGPFTLEPGQYNNSTIGVVWARATGGGAFESVNAMRRADDKAQALFDNCFRILDGPDAPNVDIQELDRELVLYLNNPLGSNNYKENYKELDPTIPNTAPDRYYRFQGYQVYQVKDALVSVSDLGDVDKARLVATCDLPDSVGQLVNWIQNPEIGLAVPTEMVNGPDTGCFHSLRVTKDLFASGDPRLVNYKTYYYIAIAYAYNEYERYDPSFHTGQPYPYKAGRKAAAGSIHSYSGIPHSPATESNGLAQNSNYGDQFQITRLEGQGNGDLIVDIDPSSEEQIVSGYPWRIDQIKYRKGRGPVRVKVVDPLNVPAGQFELRFRDTTDLPNLLVLSDYEELNDAYWTLERLDGNGQPTGDLVTSDRSIEIGYEQLIPKWGISVTVDQSVYSGNYTKPLDQTFEYVSNGSPVVQWYLPIPDQDGENAFNWIRAGTAIDDAIKYPDIANRDDGETYEKFQSGWAPWALVGDTAFQPGDGLVNSSITGAKLAECPSLLVVFTPDKSKWTRCPVLEENNIPALTSPSGAKKLQMKSVASVDKNGRAYDSAGANNDEAGLNGSTGMGWFPGYAIELETGERLNMAFGEDSFWGGASGRDMLWDPTDQVVTNLGDPLMAGSHWIYVYRNRRRARNDDTQMPQYDEGAYLHSNLQDPNNAASRSKVWSACTWVGSGFRVPGVEYKSMEQGFIPTELRVRLNVSKPYLTYLPYEGEPTPGVNIDRNGGLGLYRFSTDDAATVTNVHDVQVSELDNIGVVPNPYYAFSGYETSRLDNRVKFINLPRACTISIYNVSGTLVRKFKKDNDLTYLDWDLKNAYNVPIAGGTYICHVDVPGAGERVLKWFGVMRPVDLQNF